MVRQAQQELKEQRDKAVDEVTALSAALEGFKQQRDKAVDEVTALKATVVRTDVCEREKEYEITAELPGMDASNIDVKLANGVLTIKGEKKEDKEEKEKDYYLSERRFGSFQRSFELPEGIDEDKIQASFEMGVLTLKLPKGAEAQKPEKKISIGTK